jgi:hypothetical protein
MGNRLSVGNTPKHFGCLGERRRSGNVLREVDEAGQAPHGQIREHDEDRPA